MVAVPWCKTALFESVTSGNVEKTHGNGRELNIFRHRFPYVGQKFIIFVKNLVKSTHMHYRKKTILNKRNNEVSCRDQMHMLGLVGCRFQSFSLRLIIVLEITIHVRYYYVLRIVHACFLRIGSKHFGNMGKAGIRYHQLHLGLTIHSTALSKPFIIVTLRQFNIHLAGKTRFWQRRKFRAISPLWSATDFHVRLRLRSSGTSEINKAARRN